MRAIFLCAWTIAGLFPPAAPAAVFQYALPVTTARGGSTALLWIPPEAERLRGAVVAGMTLMEREFARNPHIRRACADQQLAIVFLKCGLAAVDLPQVLRDLAGLSGYRALAETPRMFVGHSAGGPQAKSRAMEMSGLCFGLVQYRGGVPGGDEAVPPGVPVLLLIGQFDEFGGTMRDAAGRETWEGGRDALRTFRQADPRHLASIVVEPGAGHFAWSERNARYLALFIFTKLQWVGDGQTIEVHPVFADQYPAVQPNGQGPRWADAGKPVGHSTAPILVRPVSGPVVAAGPNRLRMQYDNLAGADEGSRVTFLAYSEGDQTYRYTEQVGMLPRGFSGLNQGSPQTINFPPIGDLKADAGPVRLQATSDAGLPVEYYVAHGPATATKGQLTIAEVPARAKFPIEVKVVACQFGRGVEPLVQTAPPVTQSLRIVSP